MAAAESLVQMTLVGEALECGPVAVFVFADDLRYVAVNEYACELLGYTREELLGFRVPALTVSADPLGDYAEVVWGGKPEGVTRVRCKDGREVALRYRARETRVAGMSFFVGVAWPVKE